jgi:heat-inducible transcriptional repressor
MLSERQEEILRCIVGAYLESGKPVGSKALAQDREIDWSASTVRGELAALEGAGYLTHPHTSAGRVPTDAGYRRYVDVLLAGDPAPAVPRIELELSRMRAEVDEAMRETTTTLSQMTDLVALVTAPPLDTATIHRVEALLLQPTVVMVVVISSAGAVTKRTFNFEHPVDTGLVEWASEYLNERLSGLGLGARMIVDRLSDPDLGIAEQRFLDSIKSAFSSLEGAGEQELYMEGAARLLSDSHFGDLPDIDRLMRVLERRRSCAR